MYQGHHYDGIERMYLKYKITEDDINRGRAGGNSSAGITTKAPLQPSWHRNVLSGGE